VYAITTGVDLDTGSNMEWIETDWEWRDAAISCKRGDSAKVGESWKVHGAFWNSHSDKFYNRVSGWPSLPLLIYLLAGPPVKAGLNLKPLAR